MEVAILILISVVSLAAIVTMINAVKTGVSGTKGITDEYISETGTKRTAKKYREDYIV